MAKQAITNGKGQWFNIDMAKQFKEDTYWDGNNNISKVTDSQFDHEYLYLTKSGKWVLNKWSDYLGSKETYEIISEEDAVIWFLEQSLELPECLKGKEIPYEI